MEIKPLKNQVFIEPEVVDQKVTKSGIVVIDSHSTSNAAGIGKVIAVGDSEYEPIRVGEKVAYKQFMGQELRLSHKDLLCIKREYVLAVFK